MKALCDKIVRQMRPVVSDDLHSRLLFEFHDCCHSLNKLRVSHPSFNGESFHFSINFDKFDEHKYNRRPEPGFGLCRTTMVELEKLSKDYRRVLHETIVSMKHTQSKTKRRQLTRLRELFKSESMKPLDWKSYLAEIRDIIYRE